MTLIVDSFANTDNHDDKRDTNIIGVHTVHKLLLSSTKCCSADVAKLSLFT